MTGLSDIISGQNGGLPQIDPLTLLQLRALKPALKSGIDPNFAYGAAQNLLGPYTQPAATADPTQALSALSDLAQSNPNPAAGQALAGALGTLGYSQPTLSGLTSSLYPDANAPSPLYQSPNATSATTIGADDLQGIDQDIASMLSQGQDLHQTRLLIMNQARAQSQLPPDQLAALYNYIGQKWISLGGDPGTAPLQAPPMPQPTGTAPTTGAYG